MRGVTFVGPLPPPLNGFSNVCAMMLARMKTRMPVDVFDRAPNQRKAKLGNLKQLIYPAKYLLTSIKRRNAVLYLALSGGRGQLIDLVYVVISKILRRRVYIHHHSFVYINSPSWLNRCFFALTRNETHIVLSANMGARLAGTYGLHPQSLRVVSNAAFYEPEAAVCEPADDSSPLHLGFLSNITLDKGIVEFFEILKALKQRGVGYRAQIAGPVAQDARAVFEKLLLASSDTDYLGPVYGDAKENFYSRLDVFLFPTKYANEAEPLVVYEAMRRGAFVIACDRGAIAEMLGNGAGLALTREQIVAGAIAKIERFNAERGELRSAQRMAKQQAQRIQSSGRLELENLMASMQRDGSKPQGINT